MKGITCIEQIAMGFDNLSAMFNIIMLSWRRDRKRTPISSSLNRVVVVVANSITKKGRSWELVSYLSHCRKSIAGERFGIAVYKLPI